MKVWVVTRVCPDIGDPNHEIKNNIAIVSSLEKAEKYIHDIFEGSLKAGE